MITNILIDFLPMTIASIIINLISKLLSIPISNIIIIRFLIIGILCFLYTSYFNFSHFNVSFKQFILIFISSLCLIFVIAHFIYLLRKYGLAKTQSISNALIIIFSLIIGIILLNEQLNFYKIIGTLLIIIGIYLLQ
jgi:drug/metabolite transporter (DMT)-like permease